MELYVEDLRSLCLFLSTIKTSDGSCKVTLSGRGLLVLWLSLETNAGTILGVIECRTDLISDISSSIFPSDSAALKTIKFHDLACRSITSDITVSPAEEFDDLVLDN